MPSLGFIFVCIKTLLWDIYLSIANILTRLVQSQASHSPNGFKALTESGGRQTGR
ncbi:uncharacterized protein SCHCODRAFT_02605878 [Schizophyllum commune H4-8]|uniref:uncharacterized protein n=1 Tax=Schizophyllum commune (strain H4-8 / FGSC 9210) TaxID=578458 RepID=UPI00215F45D4|nr:uncharacterized protein SCHCODRAFT_02605878 [Schizophyllum commune H4-8]KAI5899700.1 hypothetical protein SCHCODRAFT_02605878 [Schizophyllum commune H4-8]